MVGAKCLWIAQVCDELVRLVCIWNFCKKRPESRDCLLRKALLGLVEVVVESCVAVPHQTVYACLEAEVCFFILEAQVLVVENVAECRHMRCVDCDGAVEVHRIICSLARRVEHCR